MRALVLLVVAALSGCGCGDGGDDDQSPPDGSSCGDDPGESVCGSACCSAGQRCLDGVCCPGPLQCGTSCCMGDRQCVQGVCTDCPTELCNGMCCLEGWSCVPTGCCPDEQACGETCCNAGTICEAGTCVGICDPGDERCGPLGAPVCCQGEDLCRWERCLTPGPPCHDDTECDAGELCDPRRLRCIPLPDGGLPDSGADAGAPIDAGVAAEAVPTPLP